MSNTLVEIQAKLGMRDIVIWHFEKYKWTILLSVCQNSTIYSIYCPLDLDDVKCQPWHGNLSSCSGLHLTGLLAGQITGTGDPDRRPLIGRDAHLDQSEGGYLDEPGSAGPRPCGWQPILDVCLSSCLYGTSICRLCTILQPPPPLDSRSGILLEKMT